LTDVSPSANPHGLDAATAADPALLASGGKRNNAPSDQQSASTAAAGLEVKARSQWYYVRSRFLRHKLAVVSLVVLIVVFACGFLAPVLPLQDPTLINTNNLLAPPSAQHYFGTDGLGRDYFSNVIWGIRTSAEVGVVVAILSTILGLIIGALAGYYRGWLDNILMRITDLVLTLPALAILLVIASLWGGGSQWNIVLILALFFWTGLARVVRGIFLSLREKEYVEAAKASGAGDLRIMFRHILPNTLGPVIVNGTLAVAAAILTEAALSFLGFGIKPPTPSIGVLISGANGYPPNDWWLVVFPGVVLIIIVLSVNFVGDGLRDAFDPQQRRVRA
jgi:ABC-type dipeptide/oligopeptide/nickel transport system permease subunit